MRYSECKEYIESDFCRLGLGGGKTPLFLMPIHAFWDAGFQFLFWWRLSHLNGVLNLIPRLISRVIGTIWHIDIEKGTQIGYGFKINHGGPLVVNSSAVIGDNVNICQNTTIGSLNNSAARIGNNVYIGPSVCIVENVNIGDNVTIGAGAVVVKDIPDNATAAGNPAKIISWKTPGRYIWNRWTKNLEL